jgi:hypothetical protein
VFCILVVFFFLIWLFNAQCQVGEDCNINDSVVNECGAVGGMGFDKEN